MSYSSERELDTAKYRSCICLEGRIRQNKKTLDGMRNLEIECRYVSQGAYDQYLDMLILLAGRIRIILEMLLLWWVSEGKSLRVQKVLQFSYPNLSSMTSALKSISDVCAFAVFCFGFSSSLSLSLYLSLPFCSSLSLYIYIYISFD